MQVGDLVYCEYDDKYGIFLDNGEWSFWITVYADGEIFQAQREFWEKV